MSFLLKAYMEDHLRNKDRLMKEWEALCSYQAEPSAVSVAQSDANAKKNRCPDSVPCESQPLLPSRHSVIIRSDLFLHTLSVNPPVVR